MVTMIGEELTRACRTVAVLRDLPSGSRLVGLAGTVSTLAALDIGLEDDDRDRITVLSP